MRLARVAFAAALAAALPAAARAQQLQLQPCTAAFAPEDLALQADGSVRDRASPTPNCVTDVGGGGVAMAACASPAPATQQWAFKPDGTVESASSAGQCFNADGGQTSPGTPIILYQCGVVAPGALAANDVFTAIAQWGAGKEARVLGNESGLCLSSAAAPPPPPPNGTCVDAFDCSLNGECTAGQCVCYAPWTAAPDCSALAFLPSPVQRGFPAPGHNETTWGGSIVKDPVGGKFHMFVAEMMNECPLSTWGQNSRCTHAVSDTPEGPYSFSDVAVTNWCQRVLSTAPSRLPIHPNRPRARTLILHSNPAIVLQTKGDGSQLYALFHIGDGTGGATQNCSKSDVGVDAAVGSAAPAAGSSLHVASSPYGPFAPAQPLPSCNNPAPFLLPNGTWFCVCDGFELYRSEDVLTAPWVHVTHISATGTPISGNYEDPFFFVDPRGMWHIVYHVYRTGGASAHNCTQVPQAAVPRHYISRP